MARCRGEANQALYRARILLRAWDRSRGAGEGEGALLSAFLPAVRMHLCEAYGWFLLAVSGIEESSRAELPRGVGELPAPEAGRARAPELAEFANLEQRGWLADLLAIEDRESGSSGEVSTGGLIGSDRLAPGYAVAMDWSDRLAETMARMDDSLSEC